MQTVLAHQGSPGAGELPLRHVRVGAEQVFRHDQPQHGVAQELQPLIAGDALRPVLVGVGAVGQGVLQQFRIMEAVSQPRLQIFHSRVPPVRK